MDLNQYFINSMCKNMYKDNIKPISLIFFISIDLKNFGEIRRKYNCEWCIKRLMREAVNSSILTGCFIFK